MASALGVKIHEVFHFHRCQLFIKHAKLHISPFLLQISKIRGRCNSSDGFMMIIRVGFWGNMN